MTPRLIYHDNTKELVNSARGELLTAVIEQELYFTEQSVK